MRLKVTSTTNIREEGECLGDLEAMEVTTVREEIEAIFHKHSIDLHKAQLLDTYSPRQNEQEADISMGLISERQVKKI